MEAEAVFKYQFWRFVFVQVMAKEIQTFLGYPPMQQDASFNLDAIKAEMGKRMVEAEAASKGSIRCRRCSYQQPGLSQGLD